MSQSFRKGEMPDKLFIVAITNYGERVHKAYTKLSTAKALRTQHNNERRRKGADPDAVIYEIEINDDSWQQVLPDPVDAGAKSDYTKARDARVETRQKLAETGSVWD